MTLTEKKCSICGDYIKPDRTPEGKIYWEDGNNAEPVNSGRCCNDCNLTRVIPLRITLHERRRKESQW